MNDRTSEPALPHEEKMAAELKETRKKLQSARRILWYYRFIFLVLLGVGAYGYHTLKLSNNALEMTQNPDAEWERLLKHADRHIRYPDPRMPGYGYPRRAYVHIQQRHFDKAKADLARSRQTDEQYFTRSYYADSAFQFARYSLHADARELFEQMLKDSEEKDPLVLQHCARFFSLTRNADFRDTKRGAALAEKSMELLQGKAKRFDYEMLGVLLAVDGQKEKAVDALEHALTLPATNAETKEEDDAKLEHIIRAIEDGSFTCNSWF